MNMTTFLPASRTHRAFSIMKNFLSAGCLTIFGLVGATASYGQFADPALSTAAFFPIRTPIGTTAELRFSFSNSGSTAIPANSIELAVCPAFNYYTSAGAPFGPFASAFTWTPPGPTDDDCWRGVNNVSIPAFGGGQIRLTYNAIALTAGPEITNINVQLLANFLAFENTTGNDNLQPELEITPLPNLIVNKTSIVATVAQGVPFTYTLNVANNGPGPSIANTVIVDAVPAGVTITGLGNGSGWICAPTTIVGPGNVSCTKAAGVSVGANETVVTLTAVKTDLTTVTNTATVTSGDPGCIALPPARCTSSVTVTDAPPSIAVVKGTPNIVATANPNQYTATYVVTVNNTGGAAGSYTLTDTPAFPATGVTLNSLNATTSGGTLGAGLPVANPANNTAQTISAAAVAIAPAASHTYTVVITFTTSAAATNLTCSGTPNNGAFNTATITGSTPGSNSNCGPIPVSISGNVFDDGNGLSDSLVNGIGTNAGGLTAYLVSSTTGVVVSSSPVAANGSYRFANVVDGSYGVVISATAGQTTNPTTNLPANWVNIGEGSTPAGDGLVDGRVLGIVVNGAAVSGVNFGIEQRPVAGGGTAPSQANPGGTISVSVPASLFQTGTSDADGVVTSYLITALPANATSITINGVTYTAAIGNGTLPFPAGGVAVSTANIGSVSVDPVDGVTTVVIRFAVSDDAGFASANVGSVTLLFSGPVLVVSPEPIPTTPWWLVALALAGLATRNLRRKEPRN